MIFCLKCAIVNRKQKNRRRTLKTESEKNFVHLFLDWCRKIGVRRVCRFGLGGFVYLVVVLAFDYLYIPWLAIKFRYLTVIPLYVSLFAISWLGLLVYRFFGEDIFLLGAINKWLVKESNYRLVRVLKRKIIGNPQTTFAAIATWWSPLHAYLFFKKDQQDNGIEHFKIFALGSFYCASFWGIVIDVLVLLWDIAVALIKI